MSKALIEAARRITSARRQHVEVLRIDCTGPGDLGRVRALIESGDLVPAAIVAVMGKTEGNGCVNDHTREYAAAMWCQLLAPHLDCAPAKVERRVALVMSGGTEGVLSPHFTVFTRRWVDGAATHGPKRLVIGTASTRDFAPEEIGRAAQVDATAQAVGAAMADAGITDVADVHFVQVKCPLLTAAKINDAISRGAPPVTRDTSMSRWAARAAPRPWAWRWRSARWRARKSPTPQC